MTCRPFPEACEPMLAASSSEHYPYVGVDLADETFEAHGFDVAQVMEGLGESIDSLGRVATPSARDALSAKVACMLAARGMEPRACEII